MVSLGIAARRSVFVALCATAPMGCYVGLGLPADDERSGEGENVTVDDDGDSPQREGGEPPVDESCEDATFAGPLSQFVRLTHAQYDNAVRDLVGLDLGLSSAFLRDPVVGGFSNNADQLRVNDRLVRDYQRAAESVSEALLEQPEAIAALADCDAEPDEACARNFIESFGRRAFRRPLDEDEREGFYALFSSAGEAYEHGTSFERGVALVVEAALQSPSFLYRAELTMPTGSDTQIPLSGYEIAARLAFMLWNSIPDLELLDAADAGELDTAEGIAQHARRLLDDPRAADPIDDFHRQWLGLDHYEGLTKDPDIYPGFDGRTIAAMQQETVEFFRRTILEEEGTYGDLMTSRATYVNDELAEIYGLEGDFGSEFTRVELDPGARAGFLTQPGFLASHAYFASTSPIHRGVFIQRQVLCALIPAPPGDVDLQLPSFDDTLRTTRQIVEAHTSPDACVTCHKLINEPGFAFEGYDAVGRVRDTENGERLDTTGTILTSAGSLQFTDAVNLIEQLAESPVAQRCYLTQWFRYASNRSEGSADRCTLDAVHEQLAANGYDIREMLVALTQTVNFRFRVRQENT